MKMKTIYSDLISDWQSDDDRQFDKKVQDGRTAAITWMAGTRKPSGRVRDRLQQIGFSQDVIDAIILSLSEDGYLDDLRLARSIVRRRQGRLAESAQALNLRMIRAALDPDAIRIVLGEEADDLAAARSLLQARFSMSDRNLAEVLTDRSMDDRKHLTNRAWRLLAGRGFDQSVIREAMSSFGLRIDIDN